MPSARRPARPIQPMPSGSSLERAATPYVQAVLVLRWFKEASDLRIQAYAC
jgi:hypothetical protein